MKSTKHSLLSRAFVKLLIGCIALSLLFFLTSGDILYWNAWLYLASMLALMGSSLVWLYRNDKELLEKRLNIKEKEKVQIEFIIGSTLLIVGIYALPGLDHRFKWSSMPLWLVIVGEAGFIASYMLFVKVMQQNSYASRVVEIQQEQKIVETGLYSLVRHPMYMAMTFIYVTTPIVLGSYIAIVPSILFPFMLSIRIKNEEEVLKNGLAGYKEYMRKVKYRLIPYVW